MILNYADRGRADPDARAFKRGSLHALRRTRLPNAPELMDACQQGLARALAYSREHLEDAPNIRDWVWSEV